MTDQTFTPAPLRPAVWAPDAARVDLVTGDERTAMESREGGWWEAPAPLADGTDYEYSLDGGPAMPDPRSPWQPAGVHGPSRTVDTGAFPWTDSGWAGRAVTDSVIYELHVGTFTAGGTFDTAIERLDHLRDLGIDMVEVMPVAAFPGEAGWGYDGVALYAVQDSYGGPAAFARFVDAAHARGLAVCLDVVYNHLGPDGNYLGAYAPYFSDRHHTPWGQAVNVDGERSADVRRFILDNALRWLRDFHVDALRLDAVHSIIDDSPRHLLAELADSVDELEAEVGRPLSLIAESDLNDDAMVTATADGGFGMEAQWADDVHHSLHAWLTGERGGYYVDFGDREVLGRTLRQGFLHTGQLSTFRGRLWGSPVREETDGHRFVVFAQDHDQVGNRALGDRPSIMSGDGLLGVAAAAYLLSAFTPMLFMGEEWGTRTRFQFFTAHVDPQLAAAVSFGRKREFASFGWDSDEVPDPQDPETFRRSRLDWSDLDRPRHARMLELYRSLIALRRSEPDLLSGDRSRTGVTWDESAAWLVMHRGEIDVVLNPGAEEAGIDLAALPGDLRHTGPDVVPPEEPEILLSNGPASLDGAVLTAAPYSATVVRRRAR